MVSINTTSWLIGAGSSICGAAAVLATEPVVKSQASKVTVAVATVVIFRYHRASSSTRRCTRCMAHWFTPETYGIYMGSTMHEVAQVVAKSRPCGQLGRGERGGLSPNAARHDASSRSCCSWRRVLNS
ncbi:putative sulfate exporter family transporter [Klebsiella pneumoniae subsp. pneumoniae]|nr:putative sulfate exporter family transporter [Klebsiella pneumoniae subsp. pneumoniae]